MINKIGTKKQSKSDRTKRRRGEIWFFGGYENERCEEQREGAESVFVWQWWNGVKKVNLYIKENVGMKNENSIVVNDSATHRHRHEQVV